MEQTLMVLAPVLGIIGLIIAFVVLALLLKKNAEILLELGISSTTKAGTVLLGKESTAAGSARAAKELIMAHIDLMGLQPTQEADREAQGTLREFVDELKAIRDEEEKADADV